MQLERARSESLGLSDPIHNTLDDTHACYNDAISTILRRPAVASGASAPNLLVATHNQASIEHTVAEMAAVGIPRGFAEGGVSFGQVPPQALRC